MPKTKFDRPAIFRSAWTAAYAAAAAHGGKANDYIRVCVREAWEAARAARAAEAGVAKVTAPSKVDAPAEIAPAPVAVEAPKDLHVKHDAGRAMIVARTERAENYLRLYMRPGLVQTARKNGRTWYAVISDRDHAEEILQDLVEWEGLTFSRAPEPAPAYAH